MNIFMKRYEKLGQKFEPAEISVRKSLRVNTLKIDERTLIDRLQKQRIALKKIDFLEHGYNYEAPFSMGATPEFLFGYYYLQEAASQLPVQVLAPNEHDLVLDMAASPGSKTTQMAQCMRNKGKIIALDNNYPRLFSLRINLERMGVRNVLVYKKDARFVLDFGLEFDKILLDAPCSGNYCIEENYFEHKTLDGVKERSRLQKELLKAAVKVLKVNGVLVYSTCSLEPEENEMNIDWILRKYPNIRLEDTGLKIGDPGLTEAFGEKLNPELKKCRRLWPHKTGTEGFFVAKIRRVN